MNTVRILICATFALLIAALVHSYSSKTSPEEKTVSELKQELEKIRLEKQIERERAAASPIAYGQYGQYDSSVNALDTRNTIPNPTSPPAAFVNPNSPTYPSNPNIPPANPNPVITDSAIDKKLDALEVENAKLKAKQAEQELENDMLVEESDVIKNELTEQANSQNGRPEGERAALIAQALPMARVKVYAADEGIILLDLIRPQNLTKGQILGIRRGEAGGIIGRIKMGRIESSEIGYADPIAESFFGGPVDIKAGDEIIVIP